MIIDETLNKVNFGKENEELSEDIRHDIIHRIYLGDREIWEKTKPTTVVKNYGTNTVMTWKINKTNGEFIFGNCTEVTTMTGSIDWGDGAKTNNWRSGNGGYTHYFNSLGEHDIVLRISEENYYKGGKIGAIKDFSLPETVDGQTVKNELIAIRLGKIPFDNHRLYENDKGVLEEYTSLKKIYFCKSEDFQITIPPKFCYKTGITDIVIQDNVIGVGAQAIVYTGDSEDATIWIKDDCGIGEQGLGCKISYNTIRPFNNLVFYCKPDTNAEDYAIHQLGLHVSKEVGEFTLNGISGVYEELSYI